MQRIVWCAHASYSALLNTCNARDQVGNLGGDEGPIIGRAVLMLQVDLGGLQGLVEAALSGADAAVITPGLSALAAHLTSPLPCMSDSDYTAFVHGEHHVS